MFKKRLVKAFALILAVIMIAGVFAGCGTGKNEGKPQTTGFVDTDVDGNPLAAATVEAYLPEYATLPEGMMQIGSLCSYNNELYFTAYIEADTESADTASAGSSNMEYSTKLFKMNMDGTGLSELPGYVPPALPEGTEGKMYITAMSIDAEGSIWVVEYNAASAVADTLVYLRKLDSTGAELLMTDISNLKDGKMFLYINGMQIDSEGNICISDMSSGVYVYDKQGTALYELKTPSQPAYVYAFVKMLDGRLGALILGNSYSMRLIDPVAKAWSTEIPLSIVSAAWSGSGEYDFYYSDGSNMHGYSLEKGESTKLFAWMDSSINGENISSLMVAPDGAIICAITNVSGSDVTAQLGILTQQTVTVDQSKTVLKMACFNLDSTIRTAIGKFNAENEKYKIEVTDYMEYSTAEDLTAGYTKLDTEIISGNVPDLICSTGVLSKDKYIAKGLLEDLYPYLDKDTELGGREAFIPEVLKAMSTDGALYQITPSFLIYTVAGKTSVVGSEIGWTFDELLSTLEKQPKGTQVLPNVTSEDVLTLVALSMDDFVNWNTGECSFDSDSFIKFLEFANRFPKKVSELTNAMDIYTQIMDGTAMLQIVPLSGFLDYQLFKEIFGGEISFKGYPSETRSGNTFYIYNSISMTSKCEHKDGAWEFIRSLLTTEFQSSDSMWMFPTNKAAFDKYAEKAMEKDIIVNEDGEEQEVAQTAINLNGQNIEVYAATEQDVNEVKKLISSIKSILEVDQQISKIINEEALPYFNGQKSAAEAAKIIQNRVSIYINEQR